MLKLTVALAACATCLVAAPVGEVVMAGNFIHVIGDLDKTIAFYHETLGLDIQGGRGAPQPGPRPFAPNEFVAKLYNTPGSQSRVAIFRTPDPQVSLEFAEFKDVDGQKAIQPRPQDAGASVVVLTVRSLDTALEKVRAAGAPIVTTGGAPVMRTENGVKNRMIVLKDPDGFYIELDERNPAPDSTATGNVIAAGLRLTVFNLDQSLHLYRDLIGFDPHVDAGFAKDAVLSEALGLNKKAEYRHAVAKVPGSNFPVDFVEVKGIERKPYEARLYDRGAGVLRLRVKEVDPFVKGLMDAGVKGASAGGGLVEFNANQHFAIMHDPNGVYFQIATAPRQPPPVAR